MPASKRPASLRSDPSLAKRQRLTHSTGKKVKSDISHQKARHVHHARSPSDSDNSASEEVFVEDDDDDRSPAPDQGHSLGDHVTSTIIWPLAHRWSLVTKKAHVAQRLLTHQRRAAKPHSALLADAKRAWSLARQKTLSKEERASHIASLMEIVRGMIQDIVFKHDASRIVQTIIKRGSQPQRDEVATELRGRFKDLVENKYSKVRGPHGVQLGGS
jgi:pumilio family protein 6